MAIPPTNFLFTLSLLPYSSPPCRHVVKSQGHPPMPVIRSTRVASDSLPLGTRRSSRKTSIDSYLTLLDGDYDREPLLVSASAPRPCRQLSETSTENVASFTKTKGERGPKLSHPASKTSVGPITIKGTHLTPSVVFDTFWRFAAERKAIDDRRRLGLPSP